MQTLYKLILESIKLKTVFRTTITLPERKESTAEHSWSASLIALILLDELKKEFGSLDEAKILKLILIHDIVEVYAGDVIAFDSEARKNKEIVEAAALKKLMSIAPVFGETLSELWHEFENKSSVEAKIAKAADAICPIFQRLQTKQSYIPFNITLADLEKTKFPHFAFSENFKKLYAQLIADLLQQNMIAH